jgi:large subunit ribosomal protein L9
MEHFLYTMSTAKITIELLQDIANIGRKWAIIEVSSSQARNFLIPKGFAKEITKERLEKIEQDKKRQADMQRLRLEQAFEIQKQLDGQKLSFILKWKNGKVFGGLDEHAIASKVQEKFGIKFEKQDIKLPNRTHIKTAGSHLVYFHITRDTLAKIIIEVGIE